MKNKKTIIILGPTASGKTKLAIDIANKYDGEIISADSRQVYKKLDIGSGKDLEDYKLSDKTIKYHLINIVDIDFNYSVYNFQKDFIKSYNKIINSNKMPIICGGSGLYIESLLLDYDLSNSPPPDYKLRSSLQEKSFDELLDYFKEINSDSGNNINDTKNRLIRNIEKYLNKKNLDLKNIELPISNYKIYGIFNSREEVREKITKRLKERLTIGLIDEVKSLINEGVSHKRLYSLGLEYRFVSDYLQNILTKEEMFQKLNTAIHRFSKKQMTFFRRMEKRGLKINWIKESNIKLIQ
jgi:tRNA dimethylallyltransferase|tara:strand:- start:2939 stop:3829 length:891 start_codon:yes stop_codon:yes gene_type:complete